MFWNTKKGTSVGDAGPLIITLVIVGIVGAIGLTVLAGLATGLTGDAAGAVGNATAGITQFFSLVPTLGLIFISVILLAAVVGGFMYYNRKM